MKDNKFNETIEEMKKMKAEGLISYQRSPKVNYEQVYKNNNIITYQ